jgi:hypothetical protein
MKKSVLIIYTIIAAVSLFSCFRKGDPVGIRKGPYAGDQPPGINPELFAPGFITNAYQTRDMAITPDGNEIYFGVNISKYSALLVTRQTEDGWTNPEVVVNLDNPDAMFLEPALSFDGKKLFFISDMPINDDDITKNHDIWVMDREGKSWSEPYNLGPPVNSELPEFYPSLTSDGTIYFTRNEPGSQISHIYRSRFETGNYLTPEKLPEQVNSGITHFNAFIAYDESYIIVPTYGREDSFGSTDYYIVFRNSSDNWSNPINLGDRINTPDGMEYSAYVTRDGNYLFFMSRRMADIETEKLSYKELSKLYSQPESGNSSIYWMQAGFIDSLKQTAVFN